MRDALKIADMMAPCILFIDEIEKALSGVQSSGLTDGGTGARVFGALLTWLNDHKSDVFFVGTCNDITQLMAGNPEFARAERFDGMFFFDLPAEKEREAIWNIYLKMFEVKKHPKMADLLKLSTDWTGAEIRSCCRLSAMLEEPLEKTAETVVPIIKIASERLTALRNWADGQCLSANEPGLFYKDGTPTVATAPAAGYRKVSRE
jgi:SpoVK/Ycf46/Vps4 family AAA+-type ATPase